MQILIPKINSARFKWTQAETGKFTFVPTESLRINKTTFIETMHPFILPVCFHNVITIKDTTMWFIKEGIGRWQNIGTKCLLLHKYPRAIITSYYSTTSSTLCHPRQEQMKRPPLLPLWSVNFLCSKYIKWC